MRDTVVKICGVRSPEIARTVSEFGGDLMGLIFAPSKRQVTIEQAQRILAGLGGGDVAHPKTVGVFVNESADRVNEVADRLQLDFVQLSGDEPAVIQTKVIRPVIRALRLPAGLSFSDARREAERYLDCPSPARVLLLDTHVPGAYGGSGVQGDWEIAARVAEQYPVILAGGLGPDTVRRALEWVHPLGVDVSSGVETEGDKDPSKIRQFIEAVRRGDESQSVQPSSSDMDRSHR